MVAGCQIGNREFQVFYTLPAAWNVHLGCRFLVFSKTCKDALWTGFGPWNDVPSPNPDP